MGHITNCISALRCEKEPVDPRKVTGFPGISGTSRGPSATLQGPPPDHKNDHISANCQRQKLSIAASESFRCNASSHRLPWAVLSCILSEWRPFRSPTKQPRASSQEGMDAHGGEESAHKTIGPGSHYYIRYTYA